MALTTQTATDLANSVVTDVNGNAPAPIAPRPRQLSPEARILFDKAIIARPLLAPEVCSIHVKNTEYYYRWVASHALGGQIYMQRRAMGFINATADDVEILVGDTTSNDKEIRAGDLILMKLPMDRWASHVKSNMERARMLGNMRGVTMNSNRGDRAPSNDVMSDDTPVRASVVNEPFVRGKAEPFIPSDPDSMIDRSISSGAADKTRAMVDKMRSKIDSEKGAR